MRHWIGKNVPSRSTVMKGKKKRIHRSVRADPSPSGLRCSVKIEYGCDSADSLLPSNAFWSFNRHFAFARSILSMVMAIIMMITEASREKIPVECSIFGYHGLGCA
jgi:hypothetical protein